jgi:hypothetical protein
MVLVLGRASPVRVGQLADELPYGSPEPGRGRESDRGWGSEDDEGVVSVVGLS